MSLEWVAPTATAAVGITGIIATVWTQRRGRQHTLQIALDARAQDRRQAACERILRTALATTEFVEYADLIFHLHAMPPDVDTENYDMWLQLDLYATDAFRQAYDGWSACLAAARAALDRIPEDEELADQTGDFQVAFDQAAERLRAAFNSLVAHARRELAPGGQAPGPRDEAERRR